MTERKVYLNNSSWQEALDKLLVCLEEWLEGKKETISVMSSLGRITAEPVFARLSSPHFLASAMDGYALRAADSFGATELCSKVLCFDSQCQPVDTGDPLPSKFDSVVKIEDVLVTKDGIELNSPVFPGENVRPIGEDIVATELLLGSNHQIRSVDLAAMISGGVQEVAVRALPEVWVIPTGDELIPPGNDPAPGQIIDSNSYLIEGLVKEWGGKPKRQEIVPDNLELIKQTISKGIKNADIVVVNAGSSAGTEDFTANAIEELGQVLVHGVAVKPGKPMIVGLVENKPVLGLPGYPVSTALNAELFLKPLIYKLLRKESNYSYTKAFSARQIVSPLGMEEFVRVKLGKVGIKTIATPISRGAGVLTSLVKADGIIAIPENSEGIRVGEETDVRLLKRKEQIENTLVIIGSHDPILDLLSNQFTLTFPGQYLASTHVGSMAGLFALKRGEAHLAGIHLLDPETGDYNRSYLEKYSLKEDVVLVNLVYREQGLILAPGVEIGEITQIAEQKLKYVNRQRGAGTRLLFDYLLQQNGLTPMDIKGYEREEFTHLAVAAAIANGTADVGMGIQSAAWSFGLDFIPLTEERYDLAIMKQYYDLELVQKLLAVIQSAQFAKQVRRLPGYDLRDSGKIIKL